MSEISFVQTLLLFIMSSCPNLLWEALAPSLPSSGKKLKLNPKVEEKKAKRREKNCVYSLSFMPALQYKSLFFSHVIYYLTQIFGKKPNSTVFLKKVSLYMAKYIIIPGHFLFFSLSPLSLSLFLPVCVVFNTLFLSLCSPGTCFVDQAVDQTPEICLPLPPEHWDSRNAPPHPAYTWPLNLNLRLQIFKFANI